MLSAITESGRRICISDIKNDLILHKMKEGEKFYCPECKEKLILKIGRQKIPHFAHYRVTNCSRYENESSYHLAGKEKLYLWLKDQGFQPQLEPYDQTIAQRPDICFTYQGIKIAIEFQCSIISEPLMKKRTNAYTSNNYYPIWILGGNQFKRKKAEIVSISSFQYSFLSIKDEKSCLLFYCPNSNQLIFVRQIIPTTLRNAVATISIVPLQQVSINDLLTPPKYTPFSVISWQKEMNHFKTNYALSPKAFKDPFLRYLYENHHHITQLPPEIGLPVPSSPFIKTPPIIWQSYIYFDVIQKLNIGDQFSIHDVIIAIAQRIRKKQIIIRDFSLGKGDVLLPVNEYLNLLVQCQYLIKVETISFQIARKLEQTSNASDQKIIENAFYQKYQKVINLSYRNNE